ncbi:hypothetical protein Tco_1517846 [Tanacetum coccineum]
MQNRSSTHTALNSTNNNAKNVFANERQHSEKHVAECADERVALVNLIAKLTLDTEENKTILKQLKKANAIMTQELEKSKLTIEPPEKEAKSHKTTKRYMPVEKASASKKPERQIPTGHRPRSSMFKRRLIAADQASVFMAMMSDHNSSDLAPQRQEMFVENVSSGLVPQGQKASDYDNSDPSLTLIILSNHTHDQSEENNNDFKHYRMASFQEAEFINPFCTRVQETGESSSRNIDNTDVHSFQPQSHDYRWTRDHPLEQVCGNPTMPVQTRRQLATDPEMCMFALTVSIVEPKNIKEAMADSIYMDRSYAG